MLTHAIFTLDLTGLVTGWNPGAARIMGYSAEEIVGRHYSVFYPPDAIAQGTRATTCRPLWRMVARTTRGRGFGRAPPDGGPTPLPRRRR